MRDFSGRVDSLDANVVEVFVVLIGFWELRRLGGYNPIIEGDSFSAIQ